MMEQPFNELDTVDQLTRPEHLLVWAMRAIALGHEECPTVRRTFRSIGGARGDQLLQTYTIFIKYLAMASPRRLQVHIPGCLCVGSDEATALAILDAGQRSLRDHSEVELRRTLNDLIGGRLDESLLLVVQGTASLLNACGLTLPDRTDDRSTLKRTADSSALLLH